MRFPGSSGSASGCNLGLPLGPRGALARHPLRPPFCPCLRPSSGSAACGSQGLLSPPCPLVGPGGSLYLCFLARLLCRTSPASRAPRWLACTWSSSATRAGPAKCHPRSPGPWWPAVVALPPHRWSVSATGRSLVTDLRCVWALGSGIHTPCSALCEKPAVAPSRPPPSPALSAQ